MRAFSARLTKAYHRANEWSEDSGDDDGYSQKCSEAGAAKHTADNDAHRGDDKPEE